MLTLRASSLRHPSSDSVAKAGDRCSFPSPSGNRVSVPSSATVAATPRSTAINSLQKPSTPVSGIGELARTGKYDVWILDQFGVLHDGKKAYPQAIEAVESLARIEGVKVVILSNSSRPPKVTREKLPQIGFNPDLFHSVITSGGLTHRALSQRDDPWFQELGRKCVHITWTSRGGVSLEGLGLTVVESFEDAEFLLAHGTEGIANPDGTVTPACIEQLGGLLERAVEVGRGRGRMMPLIIANPDFVTVEERALRVMPGTLGRMYTDMGGEVKCMGKPDPVVFEECSALTGCPMSRMIMVGDSLHHDIQGAANSGIDSLFICGGIHADELGVGSIGSLPEGGALERLLLKEAAWPTYVAPLLQW